MSPLSGFDFMVLTFLFLIMLIAVSYYTYLKICNRFMYFLFTIIYFLLNFIDFVLKFINFSLNYFHFWFKFTSRS